jgi:TPR repeat protein
LFDFQRTERDSNVKIFRYDCDDANPDNLYIEIFNYRDFTADKSIQKQTFFRELATKSRKNPYDLVSLWFLARCYLDGYGTKQNISKAEIIFRKWHRAKNDIGTIWLIRCMIKQKMSFKMLYNICNERTDSQNGWILYKIGQGHILNQFGNSSNIETGISFLEKSVNQGYQRAIRLLCIMKLKMKFGFEKSTHQLFLLAKHLSKSSDLSEHCYYGICLVVGIEPSEIQKKE